MTKILAFSGRKQSGKSTAADYVVSLINNKDITYKIYNFADPLKKDICMNILGLTYDQCYGTDENKNTLTDLVWDDKQLTAREAMEIIGTSIFRKLKNNVWIDATINKIKQDNLDIAIIPDCRFPNEVDSIKAYGGHVIRLALDPFNSNAPAEIALDKHNYDWHKFDYIVFNTSMTIEEKNKEIYRFLSNKGILKL
ncbi:hypothetical protein EB118_12435 [bacterium]|nr:hypothetical protein [bacterium]NDC95154.1 hypothetical protein [bacterium]NDD84989.1 hypothetical protein [bacterium]NDG30866.1 hypothetical protein [bacterium]